MDFNALYGMHAKDKQSLNRQTRISALQAQIMKLG